ncbi:MAG: hypothetical protein PSV46_17710 [Reyranella sp.]|nr:hypothetical protein [Reyranella sp.]
MLLASTALGTAPARAQQPAWQTITGADGRYSFEIPTPFKQSNSTGDYNSILRGYMFEWGGGRYGLDMTIIEIDPGDADHPAADVGVLLKNGQSNVQKRWPGSTVLQQGEVSQGRAQGRSFTLSVDGGRLLLIGRAYFLDARLYVQVAITSPDEQNSTMVTRFLNSLRIVG